ncbi:hypothetical protein SHVI106290_06085 [Shewanella violacea]
MNIVIVIVIVITEGLNQGDVIAITKSPKRSRV